VNAKKKINNGTVRDISHLLEIFPTDQMLISSTRRARLRSVRRAIASEKARKVPVFKLIGVA
jgi:hypothetical protein